MINIILIAIESLLGYILLVILNKKYKTDGIYAYSIVASVVILLMSLKQITIMNVAVPLGLGITTTLLIGANIIVQNRGKEELKTYLALIVITFIVSCVILNLSAVIIDSDFSYASNRAYDSIFIKNIRIYIALITSTIFAIWLDSELYYTIKKIQNKIILNNIFSIIIVEFFENIVFIIIAFVFEYQPLDLFLCIVLRYIIKTIIGIIGTIPIYISNRYN